MKANNSYKYPKTTADEILDCMNTYSSKYFDKTLCECAERLLRLVQKNRKINFFNGGIESWAAAIIYFLARYNFLFDENSVNHIRPESISEHFFENMSKLIRRVERIDTASGIELDDDLITLPEVRSIFDLFVTSSGFIISKFSIESSLENITKLNPKEAEWAKKRFNRKIKSEKEKYITKLERKAKNTAGLVKNQLELFG